MRPDSIHPGVARNRTRRLRLSARRTGGFALIGALALLVVLGSTGAVMIRLTGIQQAGSTVAILGLRADWAARSGLEWAFHEGARLGGCPASVTTLGLSEAGLSGFQVVVRCTESAHSEGSAERAVLVIRSEASFGAIGSRDYVFREIQASLVL